MKKLSLILGFWFLGIATVTYAQEPPPPPPQAGQAPTQGTKPPMKTPEERATDQTNRMKNELLLDQSQYDKVYTINLEILKKLKGSMVKGDREANMTMRQNLETERQSKVMDVLNQPQKEKYQKMIDKEKARMQQRMDKGAQQSPPPPPADAPAPKN